MIRKSVKLKQKGIIAKLIGLLSMLLLITNVSYAEDTDSIFTLWQLPGRSFMNSYVIRTPGNSGCS